MDSRRHRIRVRRGPTETCRDSATGRIQKHIEELARLWNVSADIIPHWAPPTHAMQIFRYCEQGSIQMLWISATNPAVSLPDLPRIRKILDQRETFPRRPRRVPDRDRRACGCRLAGGHVGRERPVVSPMSIALCIYPTRPLTRPAKHAPILIFFWTMPAHGFSG